MRVPCLRWPAVIRAWLTIFLTCAPTSCARGYHVAYATSQNIRVIIDDAIEGPASHEVTQWVEEAIAFWVQHCPGGEMRMREVMRDGRIIYVGGPLTIVQTGQRVNGVYEAFTNVVYVGTRPDGTSDSAWQRSLTIHEISHMILTWTKHCDARLGAADYDQHRLMKEVGFPH